MHGSILVSASSAELQLVGEHRRAQFIEVSLTEKLVGLLRGRTLLG